MTIQKNIDKNIDNPIYIGVMSGTSLDGLDIAVMSFNETKDINNNEAVTVLAVKYYAFENSLLTNIKELINDSNTPFVKLLKTNVSLSVWIGDTINEFLHEHNIANSAITAIGLHGITILHQVNTDTPFSCQISDGSVVANKTNITVVNDFRSRDVAAGGQGAPLVVGFHGWLARQYKRSLTLLNIGGISNISLVDFDLGITRGHDIGPGNCLLDANIRQHENKEYDKNGQWAKSGTINEELLNLLLQDSYFSKPTPKSTGVEYFNMQWLNTYLAQIPKLKPQDIQATLIELNACLLAQELDKCKKPQTIYVFGGGTNNTYLMERMQLHSKQHRITTSNELNINPDFMEAIAFAWLAKQTYNKQTSNVPTVTGADGHKILGAIHFA